jgi:heme-degrading monooxygenase HmoA
MNDLKKTPYYAVIFSSIRTEGDQKGYEAMAKRMTELAETQPGFLGLETARSEIGLTISYWKDKEAIHKWKSNAEHVLAQVYGKNKWYKSYKVRIAKVEYEYGRSKL